MAEFLLELFSEEIPARMQKRAAEDLKRLVTDGLKAANLEFSRADAYATPRRLALVVDGLPEKQPDIREERKGPRVDAPEKAIQGFLRGAGLESLDQCEKRDTGKGEAWFAVIEKKGQETHWVLSDIVTDAMSKLPWPKSMRWSENDFRWIRPLHNLLGIFGGEPIKLGFDLIGQGAQLDARSDASFNDSYSKSYIEKFNTLIAVSSTKGHRFLAPAPFAVSNFADYKDKLRAAKVILDAAERREIIASKLNELAAVEGLTVRDDPALLDEVAGLVEWPVPLLGSIDEDFMDVPAEALTSSMREHQKYFSLLNADGSLAPQFGFVANMETADKGAAIIAGNERVLRARLSDAKFFWDQDRRTRLEDRVLGLDKIVFHAKLGNLAERVQRITALATACAANVPGANRDEVRSAATLCKADLVTGMVGEFPDLQGIMGRYYALGEGESPNVAQAIAEHYSPQGPNDACPTAPVSVAVALAEKLDTLVGFWLIDEKPTGSKDPFALRRAALGVIRLILENNLRLNLLTAFAEAMRLYQEEKLGLQNPQDTAGEARAVAADLISFFADRLKVHLREQGVRHDLISAVFALGGEDDLVRLLARVAALGTFLESDDGANLLTAYRRGANIVRIEEKKDGAAFNRDDYNPDLGEGDEAVLWDALQSVVADIESLLDAEDFAGAMGLLAKLRKPVDTFFETVTVNDENPALRKNRLCLLAYITWVMNRIADFSQIEGS